MPVEQRLRAADRQPAQPRRVSSSSSSLVAGPQAGSLARKRSTPPTFGVVVDSALWKAPGRPAIVAPAVAFGGWRRTRPAPTQKSGR
ncbi:MULTISPECIES: hypothetical protein [unclassified Conexibacter]|uniref:hypothetical protein n=1 Tax=unclassified Conexibacter TaxID=2627773 RepID=UPI00271C79F8|nr:MULTISPECIES: hypothetical protein [unclassified Conexibacter]MDO8185243.1 hypothetical protein [Conexibacter sp. CPCC 205706]MDO8198289.1 hypothetical protein [Conexibacter sp. CPCC 205762]